MVAQPHGPDLTAQSIKYNCKHSQAYMTTAVLCTPVVSSLLGHTAVPKTRTASRINFREAVDSFSVYL